MDPIETLRQAMLADIADTLKDKKNNLMRQQQPCHCRNNCDYALGQLKKSADSTITVFQSLEKYVLNKTCRHTWHRERMMEACWDALPRASSVL